MELLHRPAHGHCRFVGLCILHSHRNDVTHVYLPVDWTAEEQTLLGDLVQFQCNNNQYNQVASLYFTDADTAMQQLFHFKEVNGSSYETFTTGK